MLIENTWTNKIFDIESIKAENIKVVFNNDSLWYRLHFIFTYAFVILIIFTYLYMIIKSSRMYREAYGAIAVVIFIGFSFDIATIGSDSIYDLTMIIYGAIAIIIYYLTYRYVPNELIENMLSLVVRDMNNGIICYDRKGRCIYYNDLMEAIYRHGGNMSVYESKYSQWIEKLGDDRRDSMTFQTTDIEINGEKHYFEIAYKRIYDESNRVICDYFVYNDRTQMYESWEQEKYKASHDSLTGLLNRDQFYEDVHDMVNKYHDTTFYLICSNIKDFKFINEIFGMEKGNQVLIKQAKLMASNPSERTICARLMNDRFALCLPREEFDEKRGKIYNGIRLITIPTFKSSSLNAIVYSFLATLRALFGRYGIIHYHAEGPCVMLGLPKLFGYRTIATIHGLDWQRAKWGNLAAHVLKYGEKQAARKADEVIVLSRNVQEYFWNTYHRRTVFIPNGIEKPVRRDCRDIREKYGLERDGYILFLARLVPEKGVHYLIEAYQKINTDKKLVIAGGNSHAAEYMHKIYQYAEQNKNIIMTGFVQGRILEELYSNASIFVLPSDIEGMALSLLEAMSYGNCCLVSDIPENMEVVEEYAEHFKKGDVEDLKRTLQYLVDNFQIAPITTPEEDLKQ